MRGIFQRIPCRWNHGGYYVSFYFATKTPVVERISEKESALYALNASDFKFSPARLYHQSDKEHPFGHGRLEYVNSTVMSAIILYVVLLNPSPMTDKNPLCQPAKIFTIPKIRFMINPTSAYMETFRNTINLV